MAKKVSRDYPLPSSDGLLKVGKRIAGENTSKIQTKNGKRFATVMENTRNGMMAGDTIMLNKNTPTSGGYISGGDYRAKKVGPKKYNLK